MLSYLHRYHAGNFADVHKHLLLSRVLLALARKETPFCVIDTHAGEGGYDLSSAEAVAGGEAADGVARFLALTDPPEIVRAYRDGLGGGGFYPGSPLLALRLMRPADRLLAVELHPRAHEALRRVVGRDPRAHLHRRDAMEALLALVPPPEKRGVAVIDPAYEVKDEYRAIPAAVAKAVARWRGGVYFVWYPLLPEARHEALLAALADAGFPEVLVSEWHRRDPGAGRGLYGSGVAVVNPPWRLDEEAAEAFGWLESAGFGGFHRLRRIGGAAQK
jgi:23S rRNA (adenine2030-N6)-methyltransferase